MKRWITWLTVLLLIASLPVAALAANADEISPQDGGETEEHVHSWGPWQEIAAPACDKEGQQIHTCTGCGKEETGAIATLPHSWGPWQEITAPTCDKEGQQVHTCTSCGKEESGAIATLPHSWGPWQEIAAPTCDAEGTRTHTCSKCSHTENQAIAAKGHTWGAWTTILRPTCTEKGLESHTCTVCQTEETRDMDPRHSWRTSEQLAAPTCTEPGKEERRCNRCGTERIFNVEAIGHIAGEAVLDNEETISCTVESIHEAIVSCATCGEELSRETVTVSAKGHVWGEWAVTTEAACTEVGEETRSCTACPETEHRELAAKGHEWQYVAAEEGHIGICTVCSTAGENTAHAYNANGDCPCGQKAPEEKTLLSGNSMVKIAVAAAAVTTLMGGMLLLLTKAKGIQ